MPGKVSTRKLAIKEVARQRRQFDTTFKHQQKGCWRSFKIGLAALAALPTLVRGQYLDNANQHGGGLVCERGKSLMQISCKNDGIAITSVGCGYNNSVSFNQVEANVDAGDQAVQKCRELLNDNPCNKSFSVRFAPTKHWADLLTCCNGLEPGDDIGTGHTLRYAYGNNTGNWTNPNTMPYNRFRADFTNCARTAPITLPTTAAPTTMALTNAINPTNGTAAGPVEPVTSEWQNPNEWGKSAAIGMGMIAWVVPAFMGIACATYWRGKRVKSDPPQNSVVPQISTESTI